MTVTISYTFEEIADITDGTILLKSFKGELTHLLLDSRKLLYPESTIFFAISNKVRSGIEFIAELYQKGVRHFFIDQKISLSDFPNANFILGRNVLNALQALAAYHRKRFSIPIIGITGSNGKTIVKEWLDQLLSDQFLIVRSPRSYNSQIGVPISILQMNGSHTLGIFEAGISEMGEMDKLEKMIQPTIGVLTNIGDAHDLGFTSTLQKLREKWILFKNANKTICRKKDVQMLDKESEEKILSWDLKEGASLTIHLQNEHKISVISGEYQQQAFRIEVPFTDDASIENCITCLVTLLYLKIPPALIIEKMAKLQPVEMRLELKEGINHCSIINDSYSADLIALNVAIDFLVQQKQHEKKTVILSDILESGKTAPELYREISILLLQKSIHRFIGIGPQISEHQKLFFGLPETHFFNSTEQFIAHYQGLHFSHESILLKGARIFEFERISRLLEKKTHQTILSINLSAIGHNLREYKKFLAPKTRIMAMVKAFSYGSGSYEIASLLQFLKVDYLAVAYADEGVELRKAGITLPILVMNPEESTFDLLLTYNLEPEIFSFFILEIFEKHLVSSAIDNHPIHIKIDTGMHRLGFDLKEVDQLASQLVRSKKMIVKSVFSHLIASEDVSQDEFSKLQASRFNESCEILESALGYPFIRHIANTSAIHRHKELQLDMVRLGIGLYGIDSNPEMQEILKTVGILSTTIAQIRHVKKGESVGYGRHEILSDDRVIATVRIGYADGYSRALSNGVGKMSIKGQLVPTVGNVCMDMTMLDITGLTDLKEGDPVQVYGNQLPVQKVAEWAKTISYDIISGISQRVKRVYYEE